MQSISTHFAPQVPWSSSNSTKTSVVFDAPPTLPYRRPPGFDSRVDDEERKQSSDVTPKALRAYWHALTELPEPVFKNLFSDAVAAEKRKFQGNFGLLPESLKLFLDFWGLILLEASNPVLSISPKGCLVGEWFLDPDNSLVLMFGGEKKIFFSLFDQGFPCEGIENGKNGLTNLAQMFLSRAPNPFMWSDLET